MFGNKETNEAKLFFLKLPEKVQEIMLEHQRIKQRISRNGANIIRQRGRPKVSNSHKKRARRLYIEKIKQGKIDNGTYRPRGRPKKENKPVIV